MSIFIGYKHKVWIVAYSLWKLTGRLARQNKSNIVRRKEHAKGQVLEHVLQQAQVAK